MKLFIQVMMTLSNLSCTRQRTASLHRTMMDGHVIRAKVGCDSLLIGKPEHVQTCQLKALRPVIRAMRFWVAQLGLNGRLLCSHVLHPHHVVRHAPHGVK